MRGNMNRTITRDIFQNSALANDESVKDNLTGDKIVHVGFDWTYQATIYVVNSSLHFIFFPQSTELYFSKKLHHLCHQSVHYNLRI